MLDLPSCRMPAAFNMFQFFLFLALMVGEENTMLWYSGSEREWHALDVFAFGLKWANLGWQGYAMRILLLVNCATLMTFWFLHRFCWSWPSLFVFIHCGTNGLKGCVNYLPFNMLYSCGNSICACLVYGLNFLEDLILKTLNVYIYFFYMFYSLISSPKTSKLFGFV